MLYSSNICGVTCIPHCHFGGRGSILTQSSSDPIHFPSTTYKLFKLPISPSSSLFSPSTLFSQPMTYLSFHKHCGNLSIASFNGFLESTSRCIKTNMADVSSVFQQHSYNIPLPLPGSGYERCDSKLVSKIRVCSILQKQFSHNGESLRGRME